MNFEESIKILCRLCGSKTKSENRLHIFDNAGLMLDINSKINNCLGIDICEDDFLPKVLCHECVSNVECFNAFKNKSHETTNMLQGLFRQQQMSENTPLNHDNVQETSNVLEPEVLLIPASHIKNEPEDNSPTENSDFDTSYEPVEHPQTENYGVDTICEQYDNLNQSQEIETPSASKSTPSSKPKFFTDNFLSLYKPPTTSNVHEQHPRNEVVSITFQCNFCMSLFATHNSAMDHVKRHDIMEINQINTVPVRKIIHRTKRGEQIEMLKCNICDELFREKQKLSDHIKEHDAENKHKCPQCGKQFVSMTKFNIHIQKHENIVCKFCGKGMSTKLTYDYHLRTIHSKDLPFPCLKCDKKFASKTLLKQHDTAEHKTIEDSIIKCDICGRIVKHKRYLREHLKIHDNERERYQCTLCDAAYLYKNQLKRHIMDHSGETPFSCEICSKRFKDKHTLKLHLLIHSGVKDHICDYCGRAFARRENLLVHRRTHTGERPYQCNKCSKTFTQKSTLNLHHKKYCL